MLKIRNKSLQLQAILENGIDSIISEEINREFTLSFKAIIDGEKSQHINYMHLVEADNNYFNIMYTKENHSSDGTLTIEAECEHVSYELNDYPHDYFSAYGTPVEILTELFQGTNFTVGQIDFSQPITVAVNELCNKRGLLMTITDQLGGELKFNKYQISLLNKRGADRGVSFRYRKNLLGTTRVTDARTKVGGFPTVTYETDIVELEFAEGYGPDEHYELGDIVYVFDPELGISNLPLRIITETHNPIERKQGKVTVSNIAGAFIKDIYDTIIGMQQTAVMKETAYNGCHIGPENGFEAIRSDKRAKSVMNATEGISVKKGDGTGSAWENVFYVDTEGNVVVSGTITGSEIIGSNISAGTITGSEIEGNDISAGTITGSEISGGTINGTSITGSTIVGTTIKTANTGNRTEISPHDYFAEINQYDYYSKERLKIRTNENGGRITFYDANGNPLGNISQGSNYLYIDTGEDSGISLGAMYSNNYLYGNWNCGNATLTNVNLDGATGQFESVEGKSITVRNGIITDIT